MLAKSTPVARSGRRFAAITLLAVALPALAVAGPIPIVFNNQTGRPNSEIFVHFVNGTFGPGQTGADGTVPLSGNTGYSFQQLNSTIAALPTLGTIPNVALGSFTNGRMYFSFGSALQGLGSGYEPAPANPNDLNYLRRYDKIELFIDGTSNNNMNTTAIDYFSIPIGAQTFDMSGNPLPNPLTSSPGLQIITALGSAASPPNSNIINNGSKFVRVLGPGTDAAPYHDFTKYINFLNTFPFPIKIGGTFGGVSGVPGPRYAAQTYNFLATFDAGGNLTLTGSGGVVGSTTITATFGALNAQTGIYGANPPYTINGAETTLGIENDLYGWVVGDLLAAMNMGFAGSTAVDPLTRQPLYLENSTQWFTAAKAPTNFLFGDVQTNTDYYNLYAAELAPLSSAYGFAFTDRLGATQLSFDPSKVQYLEIILLQTGTFVDVPPGSLYFTWIEALVHAGITGGCSLSPPLYCPDAAATRAQMAVFLGRGIHGAGFMPPPATGIFADVPPGNSFAKWIEQLYNDGITGGCAPSPLQYCPDDPVTRAQMAIFLLRAQHGSGYTPPPATGTVFADVPANSFAASWIEQLAAEGITGGCGGGNYCPSQAVTRAQMAVFLVRTFNLPM